MKKLALMVIFAGLLLSPAPFVCADIIVDNARNITKGKIEDLIKEGKIFEAIQQAEGGYTEALKFLVNASQFREGELRRAAGIFLAYREMLEKLVKDGYFPHKDYYDFIGRTDARFDINKKWFQSALYVSETRLLKIITEQAQTADVINLPAERPSRSVIPLPSPTIIKYPASLKLVQDALFSLADVSDKFDLEMTVDDKTGRVEEVGVVERKSGLTIDTVEFRKLMKVGEIYKFLSSYFNKVGAIRAAQNLYFYETSLPKQVWRDIPPPKSLVIIKFNPAAQEVVVEGGGKGPVIISLSEYIKNEMAKEMRQRPRLQIAEALIEELKSRAGMASEAQRKEIQDAIKNFEANRAKGIINLENLKRAMEIIKR